MNPLVLLEKIKREFPKLEWKKFEFVNDGWDHYVIILDNQIIFRFPKDDYNKKRFSSEVGLLRYLEKKLPIPIPQYRYIAKEDIFAGYEIIKGERFNRSIYENRFTEKDKEKFARQMAGFLTSLHNVSFKSIRKFDVGFFDHVGKYGELEKRCQKYIFSKLSRRENEKVKQCLEELKEYSFHAQNEVLIHSDLNWDNILVNKNKLVGVIDFSDYIISDRAHDFGELWYYGPKFVRRVYDLYKGKKDEKMFRDSFLCYQQSGLWVLSGTIKGSPMSYGRAYSEFKERMEL